VVSSEEGGVPAGGWVATPVAAEVERTSFLALRASV
jgi:hypothetical protein